MAISFDQRLIIFKPVRDIKIKCKKLKLQTKSQLEMDLQL
jgi:hypothetical protein